MADTSPSQRELEILKALWELQEGTVREVLEHMCPDGELAFNTVQTLLRIMEQKELVGHRANGRTFVYFPKHNRQLVASRFLSKVFDGALDQLIVTMLGAKDASPEELRQLEKLIAKTRREKEKSPEKKNAEKKGNKGAR